MRRREFIAGLGSAAAWPLAARAQQPMPVIGYLSGSTPDAAALYMPAFRQGLSEAGYVEGKNVAIEHRFAEGQYNRLPALAAELVTRQVAVIVATAGAELAAKAATATIPVVFSTGSDPVKSGVVSSFNRPGGNVTGLFVFAFSFGAKRFDMLREVIPNARIIAVLVNPTMPDPASKADLAEVEAGAQAVGQQIAVLKASGESEIDDAFAVMAQQRADAVVVMADPYFAGRINQIVALAARYAIPAMYEWRSFAESGGLMSYGSSSSDARRQMGIYTGKNQARRPARHAIGEG